MEEKNLPNNDFVREQIKDKPKKNKGIWVRLRTSALCGAVFALAACSVVLMMKPKLQEGQETQEIQPQETERETETQMAQVVEPEETEKVKPLSIGDYQQIQTQLFQAPSVKAYLLQYQSYCLFWYVPTHRLYHHYLHPH